MDWLFVASLALYVSAITVAVSNARDDEWGRRKRVGVGLFLAGAGLALYADDAVAAVTGGPPAPGWIEVPGAVVVLVGVAVAASARNGHTGE